MRVLYLATSHLLSQHFFKGWRNAFVALGHHVDCLDFTSQTVKQYLDSRSSELSYDIVMSASNEGILDIPVEWINEMGAALVINGLPFNRLGISPEPQAPCSICGFKDG